VAFSATTSHMPDIGGRIRAIEAREIFEEGLHIPLTHLVRAGQVDHTMVAMIRANVRTPDQTMGDIWAQASANELMERRVVALMDDYGLTTLSELGDELFARSEGAMREAIRAVPDGTYRYAFRTDAPARRSTSRSPSPSPVTRSWPTTPAPRRSSRARSTACSPTRTR